WGRSRSCRPRTPPGPASRGPSPRSAGAPPPPAQNRLPGDRRPRPKTHPLTRPTPPLAGQPRRHEADPAMEPIVLRRFDELVEVGGVVDAAEQCVVQAAGDQHAATPRPKPAEAHRLGEPRPDNPGR